MTCATCPFRHDVTDECRRLPPVPLVMTATTKNAKGYVYEEITGGWWPKVDPETGWCGEHPSRRNAEVRRG